MRAGLALTAALALGACASAGPATIATYQPAPGLNEVMRGAIEAAPGHEVVVGDIVVLQDTTIAPHYHFGEEFIYVIGGSVLIERAGYADVTLRAGESLRVAPGIVHSGRSETDGARVISVWIKPEGRPLRVPVPE
jgi:quercetin dioxygenase-like cupin family protein